MMSIALTFRAFQTLGTSTYVVRTNKENYSHMFLKGSEEDLSVNFKDVNPYERFDKDATISSPVNFTAAGWLVVPGNVTVHVGNKLVEEKISYLINANSLCSTFDNRRHSLLVFVESSVINLAQRQAIRDTWGLKALQMAMNFRVVFILGEDVRWNQESLMEESFRYGDVVQANITESFRNLGKKSALGIRWSFEYCDRADFILKTDDDLLIHIPNLMEAILSSKDPETLLLCRENRRQKILRKEFLDKVPDSYRKYEVPETELPGVYYPPYCSGMAYAFSKAVRTRLLLASQVTPVFFIEDVYMTGFVRYKAGVIIKDNEGITLRPYLKGSQAICAFREGRITSQELNEADMRQMWAELNTQGYFCPKLLGYAREVRPEYAKRDKNMKVWTPKHLVKPQLNVQ